MFPLTPTPSLYAHMQVGSHEVPWILIDYWIKQLFERPYV